MFVRKRRRGGGDAQSGRRCAYEAANVRRQVRAGKARCGWRHVIVASGVVGRLQKPQQDIVSGTGHVYEVGPAYAVPVTWVPQCGADELQAGTGFRCSHGEWVRV